MTNVLKHTLTNRGICDSETNVKSPCFLLTKLIVIMF